MFFAVSRPMVSAVWLIAPNRFLESSVRVITGCDALSLLSRDLHLSLQIDDGDAAAFTCGPSHTNIMHAYMSVYAPLCVV